MRVRTAESCCRIATIIGSGTRRTGWKGGAHLGSSAGGVISFGQVFALVIWPVLVVVTPPALLFGRARWPVGARTMSHAGVATLLAVVITAGTFWVMRVPGAFPR